MNKVSLRDMELYKKLTPYLATAYAEGCQEGEGATEKEQLCAWQWLVDKGVCWKLGVSFGDRATNLIKIGAILAADKWRRNVKYKIREGKGRISKGKFEAFLNLAKGIETEMKKWLVEPNTTR